MVRHQRWGALKSTIACVLFLLFQAANAAPVQVGGVVSGNRGDHMSPTLVDDSVTDLEAADIKLTFDPTFLAFSGAEAGTLTGGFSVVAGAPMPVGLLMEVLVSMAAPISGITGGPGGVLVASFVITDTAPFGTTAVVFESLDATLYDFPLTIAQIKVNNVPLGNAGGMLLCALGALLGVRRRSILPSLTVS